MVNQAIELKSAAKDPTESLIGFSHVGTHDQVTAQLPALLKPIAKYHDSYRRVALDIGWELGLAKLNEDTDRNENHPWSIITEAIKFEPKKPVAVTLDTLEWLNSTIRKPETLKYLEGKKSILRPLIGRCFNRAIEWTWSEGRTIHMCRQVLTERSFGVTQSIRDRAFEILSWVIQQPSWMAALDAVEALEGAIHRVVGYDVGGVKDIEALRLEWRPERLKALRLLCEAITKHPNTAVRYKVRQLLKQDIAFEEDARFREEARTVVSTIPDDLELRSAIMLLSESSFEFEETISIPFTPEKQEISRKLWDEKLRQTALEISTAFPDGSNLKLFLSNLTQEMIKAGFSVFPTKLFLALASSAPKLALALANQLLKEGGDPNLALNWNWLLEENPDVSEEIRNELLQNAAKSGNHHLIFGAIQTLRWRAKRNQGLTEGEKVILLEIADTQNAEVASYILQLIAWSEETLFPWAFQLLEKISISSMGGRVLEPLLQALSPYEDRKLPIPDKLLKQLLGDIVSIPDLGYGRHREWNQLSQRYPLAIYQFLKARILVAADDDKIPGYQAFTSDVDESLNLSGLINEPSFPKICTELWDRTLDRQGTKHYYWSRLFQMIVLPNDPAWIVRLQEIIAKTSDEKKLLQLPELLHFDGSLIIFLHPEVTRSFLKQARLVGGDTVLERMWHYLRSATGPRGRAYCNGILDPEYDYVEKQAVTAAEAFAADDLLGPFFRWIVEQEQKDRVESKVRAEYDMASLD